MMTAARRRKEERGIKCKDNSGERKDLESEIIYPPTHPCILKR
jgi:hypothetical protein